MNLLKSLRLESSKGMLIEPEKSSRWFTKVVK